VELWWREETASDIFATINLKSHFKPVSRCDNCNKNKNFAMVVFIHKEKCPADTECLENDVTIELIVS
jgi:hypothetical protein